MVRGRSLAARLPETAAASEGNSRTATVWEGYACAVTVRTYRGRGTGPKMGFPWLAALLCVRSRRIDKSAVVTRNYSYLRQAKLNRAAALRQRGYLSKVTGVASR